MSDQEIKEIKERITDGGYEGNGDTYTAFEHLITLIDQQAQEIERLQEELTSIRPFVDLRMHDDKDSLELAVKALESIEKVRIQDFGELAKFIHADVVETLNIIRRTET